MLTGIGFTITGDPAQIMQALKEYLQEVAATLPPGQTMLRLRADLDHAKPKRTKKPPPEPLVQEARKSRRR